jgi:hypothetical protein
MRQEFAEALWATRRLGAALHPARLAVAVPAVAAVAGASALSAAVSSRLGLSAGMLPGVIGGLIALNSILFLPPGTLAAAPRWSLLLFAANILPMPLSVLLMHASRPLAALTVVLAAGLAMLTRAAGPIAGALALLATLNLLVPLVLGADAVLYALAPLAAVIGTAAAVAADYVGAFLERHPMAGAERILLSDAAVSFLDELADRFRTPAPWPPRWFVAHRDSVRAIVADMALTWPSGLLSPAQAADYFIAEIAVCAAELHAARATMPPALDAAIGATVTGSAAALRRGSREDGALLAQGLLETVHRARAKCDRDVAAQSLGLAVLLRDFVSAVLAPDAVPSAAPPPQLRAWPAPIEFRLALQASVTLALAFAISNLHVGPKPYWIPLTALIVVCASFGESLLKSLERTLGTVAGLLAGQFAWIVLGGQPKLMVGIITVAVFGIFFSRAAAYRWVLFWTTLALSALLHLANVGETFYLARLGDTLIGAVIALAVGRLLLPLSTAEAARQRRSAYLAAIALQLRRLAMPIEVRRTGPQGPLLDTAVTVSLSGLHALADAEIVEAAMSRETRSAVRRRLAAADRLARCLVALSSLRPMLAAGVEPAIPVLLSRLADAAAGCGPLSEAELVQIHGALITAAPDDISGSERLAASLRLLRLLGTISDTIAVLRADEPAVLPSMGNS